MDKNNLQLRVKVPNRIGKFLQRVRIARNAETAVNSHGRSVRLSVRHIPVSME